MNSRQKGALWLGIAVFCGLGLYPPWVQPLPETAQPITRALGRAWLFGSPTEPAVADCWALKPTPTELTGNEIGRRIMISPEGSNPIQAWRDSLDRWEACIDNATIEPVPFARIDTQRLAVEWILVGVVTAGLVLTLGGALPPTEPATDRGAR